MSWLHWRLRALIYLSTSVLFFCFYNFGFQTHRVHLFDEAISIDWLFSLVFSQIWQVCFITKKCNASCLLSSLIHGFRTCRYETLPKMTLHHDKEKCDCVEFAEHFRREHFLCGHTQCLEQKFVVFGSEQELRQHNAREHAGTMTRAERRQAMTIPIDIQVLILPPLPPFPPSFASSLLPILPIELLWTPLGFLWPSHGPNDLYKCKFIWPYIRNVSSIPETSGRQEFILGRIPGSNIKHPFFLDNLGKLIGKVPHLFALIGSFRLFLDRQSRDHDQSILELNIIATKTYFENAYQAFSREIEFGITRGKRDSCGWYGNLKAESNNSKCRAPAPI